MQDASECDAWVKNVLGMDVQSPGAGGSDAASGETGFFDTVKDIAAGVTKVFTGKDPRAAAKAALLARLEGLRDPAAATDDEKATFAKLRDAIGKALTGDPPGEAALGTASKGVDKLAQLIEPVQRRAALTALDGKNPGAAKEARAAFDKFDKVLGTTEVTPEATQKATEDTAAKSSALSAALQAYGTAKKSGSAEKIDQATKAYFAAKDAYDKASALEGAMIGRTALTKAISHGPLSAETDAPFPDPKIAEKLIAAFSKDGRMADAALTAASTSKFPGAVADNIGPMIDRAQSGFKADNGQSFSDPEYARNYGTDLLKMGGAVGPEYFSRLPGYMASGQQFAPAAATGEDGRARPVTEIAQKRSVKLAGAMTKPDGSVDVDSPDAKAAIGNLLFHPNAMLNPTPALNAHVLKTVDFLADPTTGPQASTVMKGVTAPTNPSAQTLVRRSLGKGGADAISDKEARTAVMASMLKPLDQGPVGSCFATAPTRRMRETQPLDALKAYADIGSKGTYKPAFGPEVPVVTNLPAGEDPIMRSWEYSTATATARNANSNQRDQFTRNMDAGLDLMKADATKHDADKNASWTTKKAKLTKDVADAFTFTYDPTSTIVDSNDGKSSTGRYIVQRVGGGEIRSQADFEAAMTDVALTSLGLGAASDDGKAVAKLVKSAAFIKAVCPGKYLPWALASGGQTPEATKALFGDTLAQKEMVPEVGNPKPPEGERTTQVLNGFLKNFKGSGAQMTTIRTVGQHGFNALPNDPSLAALKGADDAETERNVQTKLVDKGTAMKNTDLAADRAAWLFDQAVEEERKKHSEPALQELIDKQAVTHRPKGPTKPAQLMAAIDATLDAIQSEVAGSDAKYKASLKNEAEIRLKNALMKDMGAPEFVIADSNWGGAEDHTFFVVAPDPTSGEPLLWEKTEPPGSLRPAGREWVDKQWASIQ